MFIWTITDLISAVMLPIIVLWYLIDSVTTAFKQWRCKHPSSYETMSCEAYCSKCSKHLGFIGTVREKYGKENEI